MNLDKKYSFYRKVAISLVVIMSFQIVLPTVSFALTSGPTQPEFTSFEPVATTSMVDEFTGDFTYNLPLFEVPGPNGSGYAMSLSYHSGTMVEEEASWVGYGWTLNPGSITRNKRGFADDWNDVEVKYWNKMPDIKTATINLGVSGEIYSLDLPANVGAGIRYNNMKGFGYIANAGISLGKGVISLGYNVYDGSGSFSLTVNPMGLLNRLNNLARKAGNKVLGAKRSENSKKENKSHRINLKKGIQKLKNLAGYLNVNVLGSNYGIYSSAVATKSTNIAQYKGRSYNVTGGTMISLVGLHIGPTLNLTGSYSTQSTEDFEEDNLKAFGYMYAKKGSVGGDDAMMDFYLEKESNYNKRDKYLGIPFSNADNFNVSGEQLGGAFRLHQKNAGHYHPNKKTSKTTIYNVGVEFGLGAEFAWGADAGVGFQTLEVGTWSDKSAFAQTTDDEAVFFRFYGDQGGLISINNTKIPVAKIDEISGKHGSKIFLPNIDHLTTQLNYYERIGRSSYIGYNTNAEIADTVQGVHYKAYDKTPALNNFVNRADTTNNLDQTLGEFSITNEAGMSYTYGLPVYSRKEKNLQYDVKKAYNIQNRFLAYKDITNEDLVETKIGEERDAAYASTFLLTEITTPDYVDLSGNGEQYFGGKTQFIYKQEYGSLAKNGGESNNWYKWRMPYTGLSYAQNEISSARDDMGAIAEGEKEIYYLDTIKTKTHFAKFYTSDRMDGYDASHYPDSAASDSTVQGPNPLQKLDSIKLFAYKGDGNVELIKTVHLKYDYHLAQGLRNSKGGIGNTGKLTLTNVWTEYEGVVNAKIADYQFNYQYPTTTDGPYYPARYSHLENYGIVDGDTLIENPNYDPFSSDAWGNYQMNGDNRFDSMRTWLDQNPDNTKLLDPAAWQLKEIILPSGGKIHIQYEQDDYQYVQDQIAHAMVSLDEDDSIDNFATYYINTEDIGVVTIAEKDELVAAIRKLKDDGVKLYFKFLYQLVGEEKPDFDKCNVEYIDGYVPILAVGNNPTKGVWIHLGTANPFAYDLPKMVCIDYVHTQRAGSLKANGDCGDDQGIFNSDKAVEIVGSLARFVDAAWDFTDNCKEVNYGLSYLRLPMIKAKKGGGLRVRALLLSDEGIENGYPSLYGSEYIYKTEENGKIISSGVAINEPQSIREENVLTQILERESQGWQDRIISGRDKKQSEGPLGESMMPSASVGYSKVIVKNIHEGKTNPGFSVKEFYTANQTYMKDGKEFSYAFRCTPTEIMGKDKNDRFFFITGFINQHTNRSWRSQGYEIEMNNMHGRSKSVKTYTGNYGSFFNKTGVNYLDANEATLISGQATYYYPPGAAVPILEDINASYPLPKKVIGQDMEMVFDSRYTRDEKIDNNLEVDNGVGLIIIPIPFGSAFPSTTYSNIEMFTHVTTTIKQYTPIVSMTEVYQDGIYHRTENVAFDPLTGKSLITISYDGFWNLGTSKDLAESEDHQGVYTKYDIPASQQYAAFKQKAERERLVLTFETGVTAKKVTENGDVFLEFSATAGNSVCNAMQTYEAGDLVQLSISKGDLYHVGTTNGNRLELLPTSYTDAGDDLPVTSVTIIRSGRQNMLSTMVGGFVTYGDDLEITKSEETHAIPDTVLDARNYLATLLNTAINSSNNQDTIDIDALSADIKSCQNLAVGAKIIVDFSGANQGLISIEALEASTEELFVNAELDFISNNVSYIPLSQLNPTGSWLQWGDMLTSVHPVPTEFYMPLGVTNENDYYFPNLSQPLVGVMGKIKAAAFESGITYVLNYDRWLYTGGLSGVTEIVYTLKESEFSVEDFKDPSTQNLLINTTMPAGDPSWVTVNHEFVANSSMENHDFILFRDEIIQPSATAATFYRNFSLSRKIDSIICTSTLYKSGGSNGSFKIDSTSGQLMYYTEDNLCNGQLVSCIQFCDNEEGYGTIVVQNAVTASAITFDDNWTFDAVDYYSNSYHASNEEWIDLSNHNAYELGQKGKWRMQSSYVFKNDVTGLDSAFTYTDTNKNYNSGLFELELFNWKQLGVNTSKWVKLNTVSKYSPNGNPLEEINLMGISSTAKFGYNKALPYLIAQNSDYQSVMFESFENVYSGENSGNPESYLEDGLLIDNAAGSISSGKAHTGSQSLKLTKNYSNGFDLFDANTIVSSQIDNNGLIVKLWARTNAKAQSAVEKYLELNIGKATNIPFQIITQVGEWTLLEAKVNAGVLTSGYGLSVSVVNTSSTHEVWIDDVRVQPLDAAMNTYVYDVATLKLLASFDDQGFALIYQYNAEGQLVRKLIEAKGIQTVQETQYNTPLKTDRPY